MIRFTELTKQTGTSMTTPAEGAQAAALVKILNSHSGHRTLNGREKRLTRCSTTGHFRKPNHDHEPYSLSETQKVSYTGAFSELVKVAAFDVSVCRGETRPLVLICRKPYRLCGVHSMPFSVCGPLNMLSPWLPMVRNVLPLPTTIRCIDLSSATA